MVFTISIASLSVILGSDLEIPDPREFYDGEILVQDMYRYLENGNTFQQFMDFLASNAPNQNVMRNLDDFTPVLNDLYVKLQKIQSSGNSRILNLIANSVKIATLKENCAFVVGNPPWVRVHEISPRIFETLRQKFQSFSTTYDTQIYEDDDTLYRPI